MDFGSASLVHESVEENEGITNGSVSEKVINISDSNSYNNGFAVVENGDSNELLPDGKQEGHEVLGSVNSSGADFKPERSSFVTKKGAGLRKWRRIRRDPNKVGDSSTETGNMLTQDLLDSGVPSSKRMLGNGEWKQKSEGSVSSTDAVIGRLGSLSPLGDLGVGLSLPFSGETNSESIEHQSSRSSTAASAPKVKYETGVFGGFPRDKNRMRSLSGKNLTSSVQRGQQQGKVRIVSTKKVRGERDKVEKEKSHSSMESDSQSSNFVFVNGTCSASNRGRNGRTNKSEGEICDEAQDSQQNGSNGHQGGYGRDDRGEYEDLSPEGLAGDSWDAEEDGHKISSSRGHDSVVDSIFALQSAQDALEREVLKFKDVGKDISVDDSVLDLHTQLIPHDVSVHGFLHAKQFNIIGETNREFETELEDLFKKKIESEVEYLVISRTVEKLRVAQIIVLEEQKVLASEQTHILDELGNTEKKAMTLKKEAEKLEHACEDIARADEILNLQKKVWKYCSCFFIQIVALVVIITIFIHRASLNSAAPVPT